MYVICGRAIRWGKTWPDWDRDDSRGRRRSVWPFAGRVLKAYLGRVPTGHAPAEAALPTQPLPVHLLDGPTADLQELGQFPLAHSLRPLHPDVVPLLRGQAGPPARETPLGPRLRLAGDRAVPDRVAPPLAEGEHHLELELAGGRRGVEVLRQGPELNSRMMQALDHLQPVGQASGEPVDVGAVRFSDLSGVEEMSLPWS